MVQGDEAPLDWAALQDVCAYEGFGEAVGGADDAATPPVNDDMSADVEGSSDSDASDSSGEPLFGAVTEPTRRYRRRRRRRVDAGGRRRTAPRRRRRAAPTRTPPRGPARTEPARRPRRESPVGRRRGLRRRAAAGLPHVRHGVEDGAHGRPRGPAAAGARVLQGPARGPRLGRFAYVSYLLQHAVAAGVRPSTESGGSWSAL